MARGPTFGEQEDLADGLVLLLLVLVPIVMILERAVVANPRRHRE